MKKLSCLVDVWDKKGLVANLSWQPLLARRFMKVTKELRTTGQLLDCGRYSSVRGALAWSAGFEDFDVGVDREERPDTQFSLAACLSRALGDKDTLVVWRLRKGLREGDIALIVIEDGVPTLDTVCVESEAMSMMEFYQSSRSQDSFFRIVSNDKSLWVADEHIEDEASFFKQHLKRLDQIQSIPLDYMQLGRLVLVLMCLLAAWMTYDYISTQKIEAERMVLLAASDKTTAYVNTLDTLRTRMGLSAESTSKLLEQLYDLPYVEEGWVVEDIVCELALCTIGLKSIGGYSNQIDRVFKANQGFKIIPDMADAKRIKVQKSFDIKSAGPNAWTDLPPKQTMLDTLMHEKQVWSRVDLGARLNLEGEVWPSGFAGIPKEKSVIRHSIKVKSGVFLIEDFLATYGTGLYWDRLKLTTQPGQSGTRLEIELEGAFYAY